MDKSKTTHDSVKPVKADNKKAGEPQHVLS